MGDTKKTGNAEGNALPVVHRHAAGIDIGSTFHMVAVRGDVDPQPVRRFESFTGDLHRMADWLTQAEVATLRAFVRHRERLVESAASTVQHMQKALLQMNVQLHHVVSDLTGVTGMHILRAIVAGERDPAGLARLRDVRCQATAETIQAALTGNYRPEHEFALQQSLELSDVYQEKIHGCDA